MKKLFLMLGLACLFMVACNNAPKQEQPKEEPVAAETEEHHCPFCALKAEYANWETMEETAKAELNKKAFDLFAEMDAKMAEMQAEGKECCEKAGEMKEGCEKKMAEMGEDAKAECQKKCEEMKAECEAMKAAWEAFETKTLDEQKDLVLSRIAAMGMGEGKCGNHEGEGHQCQHEGEGHQCQHGEGHQCEHNK